MWLLISDAMLNICSQNFELTLNIPFCWTRCGSRESRSPSCVIKSLLFLFFFTFGTTMRMLAITTRMLTITSTWMTDWSLVCSTDPIWQASELLPTRSSRKLSFEGSSGRAIDLRKKVQSTFFRWILRNLQLQFSTSWQDDLAHWSAKAKVMKKLLGMNLPFPEDFCSR